ncbi:membrane protein insertion efficiency factor YidD [Escherichia sp. E2661]|uniref:membrane protein insertion efficiency factor YidD n=1 Tax=Escherichia sp. E2661 TaxID=2044459 RepID=UPI001F0D5A84|nr:membrane protein insertion efficiency factor YidD [Escherichia sp. E2661]
MNKLLLLLIMLYQRHLSPRKGYRCAYSVLYQTQGCSGAVKEIIQQKGVIAGWGEDTSAFCRLPTCGTDNQAEATPERGYT